MTTPPRVADRCCVRTLKRSDQRAVQPHRENVLARAVLAAIPELSVLKEPGWLADDAYVAYVQHRATAACRPPACCGARA
jgi:hypothetical protein